MAKYIVITENDTSAWKDETGIKYHFPSKYLRFFSPGTKAVYYKGKIRDSEFKNFRLSEDPHYFGIATIGKSIKDESSSKNDYYAEILDFQKFDKAVSFKNQGSTIEKIPANRATNYWRDGARVINEEIYNKIVFFAGINEVAKKSVFNDNEEGDKALHSVLLEGAKKQVFGTRYERRAAYRQQALDIHGFSYLACGINFKDVYGDWGEGYIHVHHLKPLSSVGQEHLIDVKSDLSVLCANCHAMVHRRKDRLLSIDDLRELIKNQLKSTLK